MKREHDKAQEENHSDWDSDPDVDVLDPCSRKRAMPKPVPAPVKKTKLDVEKPQAGLMKKAVGKEPANTPQSRVVPRPSVDVRNVVKKPGRDCATQTEDQGVKCENSENPEI